MQGLFPQSSHRHAPITHRSSHTPSCTVTPEANHTPLRLSHHAHVHSHIFNTHLMKPFECMVSPLPPTPHPSTYIHPAALQSHPSSHLRDSLHSPHTHGSCTGLPPRKNQSRTNIFQERSKCPTRLVMSTSESFQLCH